MSDTLPIPNRLTLGKHQRYTIEVLLGNAGSSVVSLTDDQQPGWSSVIVKDCDGNELMELYPGNLTILVDRNILIVTGSDRPSLDIPRTYYTLNPAVKELYQFRKTKPKTP